MCRSMPGGFLLLDVMLATAIVGTALAVVVASLARMLTASQAVAQQIEAHGVAGRVLSEVLLLDPESQRQGGLAPQVPDPIGVTGVKRSERSGDLRLDLTRRFHQGGLSPKGTVPLGMTAVERQGWSGDAGGYQTSTVIEERDGVEWLRVAVEWTGPGGRRELVERATVVGSQP